MTRDCQNVIDHFVSRLARTPPARGGSEYNKFSGNGTSKKKKKVQTSKKSNVLFFKIQCEILSRSGFSWWQKYSKLMSLTAEIVMNFYSVGPFPHPSWCFKMLLTYHIVPEIQSEIQHACVKYISLTQTLHIITSASCCCWNIWSHTHTIKRVQYHFKIHDFMS